MLPVLILALLLAAAGKGADGWPFFRGPNDDGMASGDAPLHWSDTEHIKWKTAIPGRGHSSPVVWGDRIFVTTAVQTGPTPAPVADPTPRRGGFGPKGPQAEQKLVLLCIDRKSGKVLWERTARVATPHEGYHPAYGSFASNSPVTDGKHVVAFFGSRGVYCYDMDGNKIWEKDFGVQLKMFMGFGEGA
jgi:outer membrane protein assembly factor BamB